MTVPPFSASIVIVTRNTEDLLKDLLLSIRRDRSLDPWLKEIIIVDNGSTDGTEAMLRQEFPSVIVVRNQENRGFAAAVNAGAACSSADAVIFLNSDTILIEGEIMKILAYMSENPRVGACGPRLVYADMRAQRSLASVPSLLSEVVPLGLLERLFPENYPGKREDFAGPVAVDSLIGAAIAVRRDLLLKLGGFDERFFFFLEETDLCMRVRENGYGVHFFPGARVIHLQGKTVRKNWVAGRIEYNISLYKFIAKHHSRAYLSFFVATRALKALLFLTALSILPFMLIKERLRMSYAYYLKLLRWHLEGCPDNGGLRRL